DEAAANSAPLSLFGSQNGRSLNIRYFPCPASYSRTFVIDQPVAFSATSVSVIRRNFARTGANAIVVWEPLPLPSAAGFAPHFAPSGDVSTRYPRGYGSAGNGAPPARPPPPPRAAPGESNSISVSITGCGS